MNDTTSARSEVQINAPSREGNGTSHVWSRTIDGQLFSFTLVNMPNGEIRWFVSRFNGYVGGPRWGCAWTPHREWIFRTAQ
jgi:hypothetical protein